MEIRKATAEDLPQLAGLFDQYRVFYRKASDRQGAEIFLKERLLATESVIYVAVMENVLVGFTQLYPLFSSIRLKRIWLLNDLFVAPACRGKGISKSLIDATKQWAKSTHSAGILLETEKTNSLANRLYPSSGFIPYDQTNFYFWNNPE